ncbi:uncharacterized protein LOC128996030 isoform X2 [Macrosteles quadrilineatus]|uniref:uncharacterized protein LOC128996030 isoform X2 n=1 Tax=Macrosteles quadrilineatus TaxID=74068 RepID=UPI0023E1DA58|nr:uncharacterized protein LOC128996030 isoform X2 [Macrosteles quadrilineatus]
MLSTCMKTMSDLRAKLDKLEAVEGPSRIPMTELTNTDGYIITAARLHSHAQYGTSVILEMFSCAKITITQNSNSVKLCHVGNLKLSVGCLASI